MPRFQFSLRAMMWLATVVCILLALMFQVPTITTNRVLLVLVLVSSSFTLTGLVFGIPAVRSFSIGAAVPLAMMLIYYYVPAASQMGFPTRSGLISKGIFGGGLLGSVALGYLCVALHRLITPLP